MVDEVALALQLNTATRNTPRNLHHAHALASTYLTAFLSRYAVIPSRRGTSYLNLNILRLLQLLVKCLKRFTGV